MVTDADLKQAHEEAVGETVEEPVMEESAVEEEVVEEEVEESEEEVDIDEVLPKEHAERSQLGRKVAALLSKTDKLEKIAQQQQETNELQQALIQKLSGEDEGREDQYLTKADLLEMQKTESKKDIQYEDNFKSTFHELSDGMEEKDKKALGVLLLEKYAIKRTENGFIDGAKAFKLASDEFYKKKTPLLNKKAPGVTTSQKTKKTEKPLTKLSASSEKLYNYIKRVDGVEAADRARSSL